MKLWSILIVTCPQRREFLKRCLEVLAPQVDRHPEVQLAIRECDPSMPLGENRQALREALDSEYISHVDDDDLVSPDFVERILPELDGVDYVGFWLAMYHDGVFSYNEDHSLLYRAVINDGNIHVRDISHVNPVKRELALKVKMAGPLGEDSLWADEMRRQGILKTENYIDEVLYFYYWRRVKPEMVARG